MPELNKANRQVCDVEIRVLKTMAPFLLIDTANTTTAGLSGDSVYAMKKGTQAIAFQNPITGTMTIEAQVVPFKLYALLSDGEVHSDAVHAARKDITATTAGTLTVDAGTGTIDASTIFVYPKDEFGYTEIKGTFADGVFTATEAGDIVVGETYTVGYLVTRTGVNRVSFASSNLPKDYFITMDTLEKDEEGTLTPYIITAYKASIQRNFDLSFSSEGDPATLTLTFDLLEDKDGNVMDIIEDTENAQ